MKKEKSFDTLKIIMAFLSLILSFYYVKGNIKISIFSIAAFLFFVIILLFTAKNQLITINNFIKFFLCFLNISSLFYFTEKIFNISYFKTIFKIIYKPLFEKNVYTSFFMSIIFVMTVLLLVGFNSLNLEEYNGEERNEKNEKEEIFQ